MTFETFLWLMTGIYALQTGVFWYGLRRGRDRTYAVSPSVSVVIAARDEEEHLATCLDSVLHQSYPREKYQVVVVDDHSSDRTQDICSDYASRHPNCCFVQSPQVGSLRGKTNALAAGIEHASGEVILITDADCTVPFTWVEETAKRYGPSVGLVGGVTLQRASSGFEGMQSLDWAYLLGVAASTSSMGNPLGSIGNNLSFRKKAYCEVGGYEKLAFSVTEDYTLVQAIVATRRWEYLYPVDPKLLVESRPCPTIKSMLRQKQRWGRGGLDMKPTGYLIMAVGWLLHFSLLGILLWGGVATSLICFALKGTADYFFLDRVLQKLSRKDELRHFHAFELYYSLYVLLLPFLVLFSGTIVWKGRKY